MGNINWQRFINKIISIQKSRYRIQKRLGEGSHATTWLAEAMLYPHEKIAIKVAKEPEGIPHECVQNEIWFLKEVKHNHIPKFFGHGTISDHLWFAMPIFDKLTLHLPTRRKLKKFYPSDITPTGYPHIASKINLKFRQNLAIAVLTDISKAIEYISGTGIVHADISPGNIMEKPGSLLRKNYVLVDWGASALIHRYPEDSFGSLHFTAPERLKGTVGIKSDLFSLGVTCYYILTGTIPYPGQSGQLYHMSVLEKDGVSPSEEGLDIYPNLDKLIKDLIRYTPEDRPAPTDVCRRIQKICTALENG